MKHIVFITSNFPCRSNPTYGIFVKQIVLAVARQGVKCTVIQPRGIHLTIQGKGDPYRIHVKEEGAPFPITVLRPRFLSCSSRKIGSYNTGRLTFRNFSKATKKALRGLDDQPDALYGHFLYYAGAAAVQAGNLLKMPAFPSMGEGELWTIRPFGLERAKRELCTATGFITNSTVLKKILNKKLEIPPEEVEIFPNGVNLGRFYPRDRLAMRNKYKLPKKSLLVAYLGNYLYQKGAVRVGKAIDGLADVAGIFMGSGPHPPTGGNIALNQRVDHNRVPELLSAADIFVLPSLAEGSSNATIEAMACGLPVIISKGKFNDDIVNDRVAIRLDPLDVDAIRVAIVRLRDDSALRKQMSEEALTWSRNFDINLRAKRILAFMEERIKNSKHGVSP